MAAETSRASKRKSTASTEQTSKKAKVAKPAEPAKPLKSALKKTRQPVASTEDTSKKSTSSSSNRTSRKKDIPVQPTNGDQDEDEDDGETTLTPDQTAALLAGFSSSDEDEDEDDGLALDKLPKPPRANDTLDKLALTTTSDADVIDEETTPGVIYIGRLPHGFYERQMRAYFSQFGSITHLKMGRNKKTGRSKHYAFIEFASAAVADIVTKTMDKYLLFNHILRVQRVPADHVKEGMWKGEGKRKRPMPRNKIEGAKLRRGTDADGWTKRIDRENSRRKSKAKKLEELGYTFEMPEVKGVADLPAIDRPALEKAAEKQLLEDVKAAADVQSNEVALQPEHAEEPVPDKRKTSKKQASSQSSKKRSTSTPAEKKETKKSKTTK